MAAHTSLKAVEFFTIQLAQLSDGMIAVSLAATTVDEQEPQLLNQEIVSERVASIEDAITLIRQSVTSSS